MKKKYSFFWILLLAPLVGCSPQAIPEIKKPDLAPLKAVVEGQQQFSIDLYKTLPQQEGNLLLSPHSVSSALSLLYLGAKEQTQAQITQLFHHKGSTEEYHHAFGKIHQYLNKIPLKQQVQIQTANALWLEKTYPFLDTYLQQSKQFYQVEKGHLVDFQNDSATACKEINQWVSEKTKEKILKIVPDALSNATKMVITNAVYFKGKWEHAFKKEQTQEDKFWKNATESFPIQMMQQQEDFHYGEPEGLQILELPYQGKDFSMIILLPKEKEGLSALETKISAILLSDWTQQMKKREVRVFIPRFKMNFEVILVEALKELGMLDAFSSTDANLTGMSASRDLFVSNVIHKTFAEVNEEGTEAAAATAIIVEATSAREPVPLPEFRADHPFLFLIRENHTQTILFMGRFVHP